MQLGVLTWMVFFPVLGMAAILLLPSRAHGPIRWTAAAATVLPLVLAAWLLAHFDPHAPGFQFVERAAWIPAYRIEYFVGVDGVSITMVLLTALLSFLCIFASFGIEKGVKGYFALFLLLETGMMGTFVALDFFLFYVFWELMLLPMYFLIGIWGGPRREYAAIKFFLYTLAGSVLILIAMLGFYFTNLRDFVSPHLVATEVNKLRRENQRLTEVQAREQVQIHSFDMIVLARAGRAALQYLGNANDIKKVSG